MKPLLAKSASDWSARPVCHDFISNVKQSNVWGCFGALLQYHTSLGTTKQIVDH